MSFIDRHILMQTKCGKYEPMGKTTSLTATENPLAETFDREINIMEKKLIFIMSN
jgi:hypothetical protein